MASNKSVVILTPNGRRQNVKVTPNTTILQILEEVCRKQGFKPEEYDLKHHNNVLDATSILRFSGLPNNAQLEMCVAQRTRIESQVLLGIQLESGTRLTGSFSPSDNLWHIIKQLCPEEADLNKNPVVIYMRQELYGLEALQKTTLRSLGLTCGRAMLRLIHRTPEELRTQANVSAPLPVKVTEDKHHQKQSQASPKRMSPDHVTEYQKQSSKNITPKENTNFVTDFIKKERNKKSDTVKEANVKKDDPMELDTQTPLTKEKGKGKNRIYFDEDNKSQRTEDVKSDDFVFLGERNAMAFSLEMAKAVPHEDLPDEFFELTLNDVRKLFNDLKKKREELEEAPLQTSAIKDLEQSKKILNQISQYKKSVIRIQFPDRTVLQGTFRPFETVEHVMKFVKDYLQDSTVDFYLYTTPPKYDLDPNQTLVDAQCVPTAIVHFGTYSQLPCNYNYLRQDIFSKFVTPSTASIAATKLMNKNRHDNRRKIVLDENVNVGASTSKASPPLSPKEEPQNKVPKWFKSSK